MSDMTLNLPIRPETQKKLKAYAMLTDRNVSQIESQLADLLDQVLTQECFELLGGDKALIRRSSEEQPHDNAPPKQTRKRRKKSFADVQKAVNANPVEEQEAFSGLDEVSGHELSNDEDNGESKSLEEQYEEAVAKSPKPKSKPRAAAPKASEDDNQLRNLFNDDDIPDVGENAEAFLEAAMGLEPEEEYEPEPAPSPRRGPTPRPETSGSRAATKSFEARRRKGQMASVQPMTGDED